MIEAAFPILGVALVLIVALPVCALLAKICLLFLEARGERDGTLHGLRARYVLFVGSSALPLAWFVSAAIHQLDSGGSALVCSVDHGGTLCLGPALFAAAVVATAVANARSMLRSRRPLDALRSAEGRAELARIHDVIERHSALTMLRDRCVVTGEPGFAVGTRGWFVPRVYIGADFASALSDESLAAALAHEAEHVRALDPLKYALLQLALCVNPFGRFMLDAHAARWRAAREAHCDREAVIRGASPLPLAEAILRASRPLAPEAVGLGPHDARLLKLRIGLLVAFSERPPHRCCEERALIHSLAFSLLLAAIALPHGVGAAPLDVVHASTEQAANYLSP